MATHLFVCGHGQSDPGAGGNGITERDWTRNPLIIAIKKYGAQLKSNKLEFYDTAKDMYQQTCAGWGAYSVSTATASVTELHLDASSNTSTSGGHVIISSQFNADKNDLAIANVVKNYVGWHPAYRSNGISLRSDLLNLNVFAKRGIGYRLVELGFITSKKDTDTLKGRHDAVAKALVEAVTGETLGVSITSPSTPKNKKRGEVMLLFKDQKGRIYWLVGNKYTYVTNPTHLTRIKEMMKQAGYDTHEHTNLDQIAYLKKLATEAK